jgi:hypothetical protein
MNPYDLTKSRVSTGPMSAMATNQSVGCRSAARCRKSGGERTCHERGKSGANDPERTLSLPPHILSIA